MGVQGRGQGHSGRRGGGRDAIGGAGCPGEGRKRRRIPKDFQGFLRSASPAGLPSEPSGRGPGGVFVARCR